MTTQQLALRTRLTYKAYRRTKKVADVLEARYKAFRHELYEHMEEEETESITVDGTRFTPYTKSRAYVDDPDAFIEWARENDPSLIQVTERKQLVTNEVRRRIDDGEPTPPGVKFVTTPNISITKA